MHQKVCANPNITCSLDKEVCAHQELKQYEVAHDTLHCHNTI
jgi:hypothetical protein